MTLSEVVKLTEACVSAIRCAVDSCDELKEKYLSICISSDGNRAWFNNSPDKDDTETPKVNYVLGYNPEDPDKWENSYER